MGRNKKAFKKTNRLLVGQPLRKTLTQSVLKGNASAGFGSKYAKAATTATISCNSSHTPLNGGSAQDNVTNDERLQSDSVDHSLIREPINLGVKNVQQILNCMKDSSLEVKDLILNECNIIYECKVCTNLFRSLANFLSHKRFYCKNHFCERMVLFDSTHFQFNDFDDDNCDDNDVVDDDDHSGELQVPTPEPTGSAPADQIVSPTSCSTTNSSAENINPNESVVSQKLHFIDKCVDKVDDEKRRQKECQSLELQLTTIKSNPNAMFQSIQNNELNGDCDETVVDPKKILCDLLKDAKKSRQLNTSETIKRKRIDDILPSIDDESDSDGCAKSSTIETLNVLCDVCDSSFTSNKTLRVHMKTIHSSKRLVFPCPLCSLAFKQLSNATRHLIQIHKRTKTQANSLNEVMRHRAYSTNSSENSSEVEDDGSDAEDGDKGMQPNSPQNNCVLNQKKCNIRLVGNENSKPTVPRVSSACQYRCGNVFDWAPARTSHEKSCRKRTQIPNLSNGVPKSLSKTHKKVSQIKLESNSIVPNNANAYTSNASSTMTNQQTNLNLPTSIQERIKEFTDLKSLQCTQCPTQEFMNLNQLLQHAVSHIGLSIYKCHGCSYLSIYENDMKYHLMNSHNINEQMIGKHFQTLPDFKQHRLVIHPINSTNNCDDTSQLSPPESSERPECKTQLKIHLRTSASKTSKKCYEIVDK